MHDYERQVQREGFNIVVGVDEAGRGPLAGPVVASAVAVKSYDFQSPIRDSKKLSARQRELAFQEIHQKAYVASGIICEAVIDRVNILEATFMAMNNAVSDLMSKIKVDYPSMRGTRNDACLLIDGGMFKTDLPYAYRTVVGGDAHVFSIACASIVAKVTRDRILNIYDKVFPGYGFAAHKGYPTKSHKQALHRLGYSGIHRRSFKY